MTGSALLRGLLYGPLAGRRQRDALKTTSQPARPTRPTHNRAQPRNQGLAQRYHVHSYKIAREVGESELAATALRGLADQAIDLGHIPTAVRLAEACEQQGRKLNNPKALAYYRNTYARAAAADADHTTASKLLAAAQSAIEHAPTKPGGLMGFPLQPGPLGSRGRHDSRAHG